MQQEQQFSRLNGVRLAGRPCVRVRLFAAALDAIVRRHRHYCNTEYRLPHGRLSRRSKQEQGARMYEKLNFGRQPYRPDLLPADLWSSQAPQKWKKLAPARRRA